ncbi:MAG: hypothetical protein ACKO7N_06985, partial [Candidatus Nitrosotenuis sp.]
MIEGGFAYGYLFMSQHRDAPKVFTQLLDVVRPYRILEIGTFHGGLTLMLRDLLNNIGLSGSTIRTYDINDQEFLRPLVADQLVDIRTKNLFHETYTDFLSDQTKKEVEEFIQSDGTTMVLCDGGCKKCEYNLLAPLLKPQDIIMAHDYSPNQEYFKKNMENKIWNWCEIEDKDIEEVSLNYKL